MKTRRSRSLGLVAVSLWLSACGKAEKGPSVPAPGPATPEQTKIARLLTEIAEMTQPRGCDKSQDCKAVGVGHGHCGPRQYIVFCPRGVDEVLLQQRVDELGKLEQAEAEREGEPPPCKPLPTPEPEAFNGVCRAKL